MKVFNLSIGYFTEMPEQVRELIKMRIELEQSDLWDNVELSILKLL